VRLRDAWRLARLVAANLREPPKQKLRLDVGCGFNKQPGFVGMDRRKVKGVDIIHDAEDLPWPLPSESCAVVLMSHLIEHIVPGKTIDVMDECWRLLEPGGLLMMTTPYATSFGYFMDPTHCNPWNEATPTYFDPENPSGLYNIYKPKPWKIVKHFWSQVGNMELVMEKRDA